MTAIATEKTIVECVPNFSEGRNTVTIDAIADEIRRTNGVRLLNVDPNADYNRVVVTFVGSPTGVLEAAFQSTKVAASKIDMRSHKGEHPRLGAADVVPFIPISGATMSDCVKLANAYGNLISKELGIPVYLYEEAARIPERRNLATIRKGEYEGLPQKLSDPKWKPDYGGAIFNPKSGATVTGARTFLIAYNVNLNTNNQSYAHEIALRIRESGRPLKDEQGRVVKDDQGKSVNIPGSLKSVKAMGVLLEKNNIAQVSINLTNYEVTPPHLAFEEVLKEAQKLGIQATGSEIVGLTPKAALILAGRFYSQGTLSQEDQLIDLSIKRLGLSQLELFDPKKKIIEFLL
jgi:glutamate formiminotransferase/formiminotetrahydrofolate cyclodeaminase